jgi:hypothetical protein
MVCSSDVNPIYNSSVEANACLSLNGNNGEQYINLAEVACAPRNVTNPGPPNPSSSTSSTLSASSVSPTSSTSATISTGKGGSQTTTQSSTSNAATTSTASGSASSAGSGSGGGSQPNAIIAAYVVPSVLGGITVITGFIFWWWKSDQVREFLGNCCGLCWNCCCLPSPQKANLNSGQSPEVHTGNHQMHNMGHGYPQP